MKVLLASARSSPGVTTATLALAGAIGRGTLVVEASRDAGTIAPRFGLGHEPGMTTLAAATRHGVGDAVVGPHTQSVPGTGDTVRVLVGPASHDAAANATRALAPMLGRILDDHDGPVLLDAGRLDGGAPALALAEWADAVVIVARPRPDEAQAVANLLPVLLDAGCQPMLLARGNEPYSRAEVARTIGVELLGVLPEDRRAADALAGIGSSRGVARSALLRAALQVAADLERRAGAVGAADAEPAGEVVA